MMADRRHSQTTTRRTLPTLGAALEAAKIPRQARILEIGGGTSGQKTLAPVIAAFDGPVFLVDGEASDSPPRLSRVGIDPFSVELPFDIDLCIAMPSLARMPDMLEGLLYDGIHAALRDGGIAALSFPRDVTDRTLISQGVTLSRVRKALQSFLHRHFGAQALGDPEQIRDRFEHCPYFEFVDVASRGKSSFTGDPVVWLVLRKRQRSATAARKKQTRAFPRSPRTDQFSLTELEGFVRGLKDAGIALVSVDEFAERYTAYCALDKKARSRFAAPCGHLKFDIHGNVRRALEIATMLHAQAVPGLFLMMHRHPLNQGFFDSASTWKMLHEIQAMGHEIGIHADPFYLIRERSNFHQGLRDALTDLRERGFAIRTATLHGDTREHIKARGLQANDFFRERYRKTKWDGVPPEGEEMLAEHVHRYTHKRIANQLGIEFFSEVIFLRNGRLITKEAMLYVSDNARAIRISNIPKAIAPFDQLTAPEPFVIDPAFTQQAVEILKKRPFLALFHPQWYW